MSPRLRRRFLAPVLACLAFGLPIIPPAHGQVLGASYQSMPEERRIAVQKELARADLFLAPVDGRWSGSTERALRRAVETIAMKSNDRLHPDISSPAQAAQFLDALGDGTYARLLYGGSLFQRIFFLVEDPVQEIENAEAARR